MSTMRTETPPVTVETIAVDARRIVTEVFPDFSLRTWRRWDSAGKCPRGFKCSGRKVWRLSDLRLWADWGFPDRPTFEVRLRTEEGGKSNGRT